MPDALLMVKATGAAAAVSAVVMLLVGIPWRSPNRVLASLGWVLGVASGFVVGCWVLSLLPAWPPSADQGRLFYILLPAVLAVECVAAFDRVPRWLVWSLRALVAAALGRVLLHGSIYLEGTPAVDSQTWSGGQTLLNLGGIAALLMLVWAVLAITAKSGAHRSLPIAFAVVAVATGVTIMLSGYATGGQLGIPLGAAIGGAALGSLVLNRPPADGSIGIGLVLLYGLIVSAHYFAELTMLHGLLLATAPLWYCLTELPYVRRLRWWAKALIGVALVVVPLTLVLFRAQQTFVERSAPAAVPDSREPSVDDYLNFGN